jgi:dTDP-4-dehydrorhamnose reductase
LKVAVIGASGQLGHDVVKSFVAAGHEVSALTHDDIELSDQRTIEALLKRTNATLVVNTAAMHHVEKCELDAERAFLVNAIGVRNLAAVTRDLRMVLAHVSTDYVFDGKKGSPYVESDEPLPLNVYGNSKLAGELFVRTINPKHFVLRTSALYGTSPCRAKGGLNFVELMLKLAREKGQMRVVDSERVSPTSTVELGDQIVALRQCDKYGLYHATAEGSCSWYDFAREILSMAKVPAKLSIASADEFPAKVPRPAYSVLENAALKRIGMNKFHPWQYGLQRYLDNVGATSTVA